DDATKKQQKWQQVAVAACKQSGQNWLPKVAAPVAFDRFVAAPPQADLVLIASLQPGSRHLKEILAEYAELHAGNSPASVLVLVGPEGDFTPSEVNQSCSAGALPLSLGPVVLRTETASIYSLSILAHELF
ncbi:MAG: RsmE family RNA methyltransferase, partial [Verrucomicrobiales bacterium]|nr:RsmE family RNA methyltransferase [Verrucomicrobiales bacterium]